ncbi:Flagellar associated protein [Phytophthora megakarya]|uniref:Flagellar associated protein n=1 Tax=Phytophthora megakarya TaxID=4795 RepID=A0A225WYK4_9STRA|nr:Flagellar associated protein [Phytophthora megakarya]
MSEDERRRRAIPSGLTRSGGAGDESLAVWESEKFCGFPKELVFRLNRGLSTYIEQVNLLSHPFKVATREEIFTSSITSDGIHDGKTGVNFERLGFVCLTLARTRTTLHANFKRYGCLRLPPKSPSCV